MYTVPPTSNVWPDRRIIRINICAALLSPIFHRGVKKCEILPHFQPPVAFQALWFKNRAKNKKSKTIMYSADVWALICRRTHAAQVWDPLSQLGPQKYDNWKNGYIVLTQPHVDRLRSDFVRWYSVATWKLQNCENPLRVESKMADDAQIFNMQIPMSLERLKLQASNLSRR